MQAENRVKLCDKRIFGGQTDVNVLVPLKYNWAWESYIEANKCHWLAGDIQFDLDTRNGTYESQITPETMEVLELYLSWKFVTSTFIRDVTPNLYRSTTAPECRQFLLRLIQEESVSIDTFSHVPLMSFAGEEKQKYRYSLVSLLHSSTAHFNSLTMTGTDFAGMVSAMLMVKGSALVGMETYLLKEAKLPTEMTKLIFNLERDSTRQRQFFTNVMANLLQEEPSLKEFAQCCLESATERAFELHWSGKTVNIGLKPAQHAKHVWSGVMNSLGFPMASVTTPYIVEVAHVEIETKTALDWD